jgi:hypothetical protein
VLGTEFSICEREYLILTFTSTPPRHVSSYLTSPHLCFLSTPFILPQFSSLSLISPPSPSTSPSPQPHLLLYLASSSTSPPPPSPLALFIGCVKHGFLALKSIARDPSLPFHRTHLERHIRNVFLYGSTDSLPAALDELTDTDMAGAYVLYCFILSPCTLQLASRITSYNFLFCIALVYRGAFTALYPYVVLQIFSTEIVHYFHFTPYREIRTA